jgi:GH25 family lysozyme M1 (1,4-beta-N-acetylmuramidase)
MAHAQTEGFPTAPTEVSPPTELLPPQLDEVAPAQSPDPTETAMPEAIEEVQAPGVAGSQDTAPLSPEQMAANEKALAAEIGTDGASLGQGLNRLAITGDPQVEAPAQDPAAEASLGSAAINPWKPSGVLGVDVSSHQLTVDWRAAWNQGSRFAYVKATEATNYINPYFPAQYRGSESVGMLRGAYHFAIPSVSTGAQQANYFINNGGGWSADGKTLPPLLDVEYNPYPSLGNSCYNMSATQMVDWIKDFSNTMYNRTGRVPMIYTTTDWWNTCTGSSRSFANHPLHIASYNNNGAGRMPAGWTGYDLWQYTDSGPVVGDWNQWPASLTSLQAFARNSAASPASPGASAIAAVASRTPSLGTAISGVVCGLVGGGCYQNYQRGDIHWSPTTGAHPTTGGIRTAWAATGHEKGHLGYPTRAQECGLVGGGCYQRYQYGDIHWSPTSGAHPTKGGIRTAWGATGYEKGRLGYPTSSEVCGLAGGGCYQNYQRGDIHWSPTTGAHPSIGGIRTAWGATGYEKGRLGYPTRAEECGLAGGGCYQRFQYGDIHWSPTTGAHPTNGGIRTAWGATGYEKGRLGYPTRAESCTTTTLCTQSYQGGTITWTPTGTRIAYKR